MLEKRIIAVLTLDNSDKDGPLKFKELDIIKELKTEEFLDFIKADFGLSNMVKLAMSHPKLAVRQLFNLVKSKQ